MKLSNSFTTLSIIAGVLCCMSIACSDNSPATSNTATAGANNAAPANTATAKSIAGEYDASGTNVDGKGGYKASLLVTPRDDVYQFSWNSGGRKYDGVGVMTDNAVAVSYTDGTDGKGCGVVLYSIHDDGSLDGKAGYWGVNKSESETATRTSGTDLEGKYEISGKNPDGKPYKGTLDVKKDGEGYTFLWNAGGPSTGFGVKTGDKVAVGIGGKQCAFVSYEVKPDGTLDGKWGGQSSKSLGTEIAKKK